VGPGSGSMEVVTRRSRRLNGRWGRGGVNVGRGGALVFGDCWVRRCGADRKQGNLGCLAVQAPRRNGTSRPLIIWYDGVCPANKRGVIFRTSADLGAFISAQLVVSLPGVRGSTRDDRKTLGVLQHGVYCSCRRECWAESRRVSTDGCGSGDRERRENVGPGLDHRRRSGACPAQNAPNRAHLSLFGPDVFSLCGHGSLPPPAGREPRVCVDSPR